MICPSDSKINRHLLATDCGIKPDTGEDAVPALRQLLDRCRGEGIEALLFEPGRYDFWPNRAVEKYRWISNNDSGLKRIAFDLTGMGPFEIDGRGAQFVFHGSVLPFWIEKARDITLGQLSINWARTFHNEGRILEVGPDGVDIAFSDRFPYVVENGILKFVQENGDKIHEVGGLLEYDAKKRETAFQAPDHWLGPVYRAEERSPGVVRLVVPSLKLTPGNILVFAAGRRSCPAITISESCRVHLDGVKIHHAGGMAVIAQRSSDLHLQHVEVAIEPGDDRVVSATADATHFVNCTGKISLEDCVFTNQLDDATNIHGVYGQITQRISSFEVEIRLRHPQQFGFDFIDAGDLVELVHAPSLNTYAEGTVRAVERLNEEYTRLRFEQPLPRELAVGDAVGLARHNPEVLIRHCVLGQNRARGFLLGSRGKIVVEKNTFHTPGAAILLEGDASFWFEQAGVRDLTVRDNLFENCNYGVWGNAVIQVGAGIDPDHRSVSRYNRNITIERNTFKVFDRRILHAYSLENLLFRENTILSSSDYPLLHQQADPFQTSHSDNIEIV